MPGKVSRANGYDTYARLKVAQQPSGGVRWHVVCFAGKNHDFENLNSNVGRVAQENCPVLCIAESDDLIPPKLVTAAHLNLSCRPLTVEIVRATIRTVLGAIAAESLDNIDCANLELADLAIAVRPGNSPERAAALLAELAAENQESQTDEFGGEAASVAFRQQKSAKKNGLKDAQRDSANSGSQIIHPVKKAEFNSDSFIPFIENLEGYEQAVDWANDLKFDLEEWRAGRVNWEGMATRLLLSGQPGTGKTMFARALCNSLRVPLVCTSVATWLEPGYLGDVIRRMRSSFEQASAHKPSILFIDEIDGIGARGADDQHAKYWDTVVNNALELLDGATKHTGVIVVAATNRPQAIDRALLRAGRLEQRAEIGLPDTAALMGILRCHLGNDINSIVASMPHAPGTHPV